MDRDYHDAPTDSTTDDSLPRDRAATAEAAAAVGDARLRRAVEALRAVHDALGDMHEGDCFAILAAGNTEEAAAAVCSACGLQIEIADVLREIGAPLEGDAR